MTPAKEKPTGVVAKLLFAGIYADVKEHSENPENKRRFAEWQKTRRDLIGLPTTSP